MINFHPIKVGGRNSETQLQVYVKNEIISIYRRFNPLTAKLFILNFHPLKVVSRWRDPQLQVSENYSDLTKWR